MRLMSCNNPLLSATALVMVLSMSAPALAQGVKDQRTLSSPVELMQVEDEANAVDMTTGNAPEMAAISVTPAMSISLDTLGLYDAQSGGVDFNAWRGSDHARVKFLLERVPNTIPSPTLRRLVAKLLLSTTRPPKSETIQQNVLAPRIDALWHIDEAAQAQRLLEMTPKDLRSSRTVGMEFASHLLKGDADWVCTNIGDALAEYADSSGQWQKYSIYCLAREGDAAKAQLAIDLLAEQQVELDAGFTALVDVMLERSKKPSTRFSAPLALDDAAMIALSGVDAFPEGYADTAPLPIARLISKQESLPAAMREKAEARLAAAIALESPRKERAALRDWLRKQYAAASDKAFNVDAAFRVLEDKGGKAEEATETRRRYRFYTLLQALDFSDLQAEVQWDDATFHDKGRTHVSPVLRSAMATAVDEELTGEAILLLAIAAGQVDDLADADDDSIADMVQALMQLGYTAEAQALAAEAMSALY